MRPTSAHRAPYLLSLLAALPILLLAGSAGGRGDSKEAAAASALPAADQLFARHVEAVGGEAAILEHTSFRFRGKVELPHLSLSGEIEQIAAA
ncbi:MAG: hypothetical protein MI919_01015, partial [Holophagales bacterium]|nr:hypothetical protein [Holophagales bacterium]